MVCGQVYPQLLPREELRTLSSGMGGAPLSLDYFCGPLAGCHLSACSASMSVRKILWVHKFRGGGGRGFGGGGGVGKGGGGVAFLLLYPQEKGGTWGTLVIA